MSRREEIEAKKQKLLELRRLREQKDRKQQQEQQQQHDDDNKTDLDRLVSSLVGEQQPRLRPQANYESYASVSIQTENTEEVEEDVIKEEKITYNKSTQTLPDESADGDQDEDEDQKQGAVDPLGNSSSLDTSETNNNSTEPTPTDIDENNDGKYGGSEQETDGSSSYATIDETVLTKFFNRSLKIINRATEEDKDILQAYGMSTENELEESKPFLEYDKLTFDHGIFSLDTSKFFPELIAVSTGTKVFIYNSKFKKLEYQFSSFTKILNLQFSKWQSNLLFGTGYNGKIIIWNLESETKFPYLVSPSSNQTHLYPVFALHQINENNGTLITASTDGKVCTWSTSILSKPMSPPIELKIPKALNLGYDELAPTCMISLANNHGFVIVGSEDGNVYNVKRFSSKINADPDTHIEKIFQRHRGAITSLKESVEFPTLFLSCSLDWRAMLWDFNSPEEPLLEIYKNNAIMDIAWRPKYPTQIAYIYSDILEIIDLSVDSVIPVLKIHIGSTLNRLSFTKDGLKIILGTTTGNLLIYDLFLNDIKCDIAKFKRQYIKQL